MHIIKDGSIVATTETLEEAIYAIRVLAREDAEAELAQIYRDGGLPRKGYLELRRLVHEGEYELTGPHRVCV